MAQLIFAGLLLGAYVYSMIESEKNYQEYKNDQRLESLIAKV
ncbi:hypothetical protein [Paucilactobacillus nenjiangensis]|nr:hypothetical protein [Paucilactobacillus nenjiangensis]